MDLRKWCSNHPDLLNDVPFDDQEKFLRIDEDDMVKTLGILWQPTSDVFTFSINLPMVSKISKRSIFSQIARIYDPLGLLTPVIIVGKLLIQSIWKLQLDWDQSLPQSVHTEWLKFRDSLNLLNNFPIDRHLFTSSDVQQIEIHGFADSSERAYGAVLYVRSINFDNTISIKLLCSKSRVAPLKSITIPRLELCAASLLAELYNKIVGIANFEIHRSTFWSDSMVTLHWIQGNVDKWKIFVRNRVIKIRELTDSSMWRHVPSEHNPADMISRGVTTDKFVNSELWRRGPSFLSMPDSNWPITPKTGELHTDEERATSLIVNATDPEDDIIHSIKYRHNLTSLKHVVAYMMRFKTKCRGKLELHEIIYAQKVIVRAVQLRSFPNEYSLLENSKPLKNRWLKSLSLFMDQDRVIRVGGRLQFSSLSYESKHPMLLPANHDYTFSLIFSYHKKYHHIGPQSLLAAVREEFWPLHGKKICSKVVNRCLICFRARPTAGVQLMGNLPADRIREAPPFSTVGVDFCGPFHSHYHIRGKPPTKTYLCVFICFITKAVHLELAADLSTDSFLGCLKRFVSSRGVPVRISSDNATNFVGANSALRELYDMLSEEKTKNDVDDYCETNAIEWKFIPPATPNFGGLHEAGVKLAKFHLRRVIGTAKLTYDQLYTFTKEVEAILNSRPITPMSNSPDDFSCLTPGHFLIGRPLTTLPCKPYTVKPPLDTWKMLDHLKQSFWMRWCDEYVRAQQQRYKWRSPTDNIAINDLVLLVDNNLPPMKWRLGRVSEVFPGDDGLVRVVKVKTEGGEFKRGVTKICPLPKLDEVETG